MNTRRKNARRAEKENANEVVLPQESQGPQAPQMPPIPYGFQAPYVEGYMTNAEIRMILGF